MTRIKQIQALNKMLLTELPEYREQAVSFPMEKIAQRRLLRSLMNVRPPMPHPRIFWPCKTSFCPPSGRKRAW